jgi:hypothetical protein
MRKVSVRRIAHAAKPYFLIPLLVLGLSRQAGADVNGGAQSVPGYGVPGSVRVVNIDGVVVLRTATTAGYAEVWRRVSLPDQSQYFQKAWVYLEPTAAGALQRVQPRTVYKYTVGAGLTLQTIQPGLGGLSKLFSPD